MAIARADNILRIPGRLVADPTDLTIAFPFGGTALGMASDIIFRPNAQRAEIRAEEQGGAIVDHVKNGESPQLGMFIRGFDPDMIPKVFEGSTVSTKTKEAKIAYPADAAPGTLASATGIKLLYAADNFEDHLSLLLYNAYALLEEVSEIRFSRKTEFGVPVLFHGIRDATNRVYQLRLMEDLVL